MNRTSEEARNIAQMICRRIDMVMGFYGVTRRDFDRGYKYLCDMIGEQQADDLQHDYGQCFNTQSEPQYKAWVCVQA